LRVMFTGLVENGCGIACLLTEDEISMNPGRGRSIMPHTFRCLHLIMTLSLVSYGSTVMIGKEKQIAIKNATWEFSDTGELVDSNADVELIMGGDIQQISVLTPSERQLEEENDEEEIHDETHSMPN